MNLTREQHEDLHLSLDVLLAAFITETEKLPSKTSVMELVKWSYEKTLEAPKPSLKVVNGWRNVLKK